MDYTLYLELFLTGMLTTLKASVLAFSLALVLGLLAVSAKLSHRRWARFIANLYTYILRGIPEIITIMALYYGGGAILERAFPGFSFTAFTGGVLALGIAYGAYATEVLRAGILAIPTGQVEAAKALGMPRFMRVYRIVLPLTFRHATPALGNLSQVLLKDTSLLSIIGVTELMWSTQRTINTTAKAFEFYLVCCAIYLVLTTLTLRLIRLLNKRQGELLN